MKDLRKHSSCKTGDFGDAHYIISFPISWLIRYISFSAFGSSIELKSESSKGKDNLATDSHRLTQKIVSELKAESGMLKGKHESKIRNKTDLSD